jgi:hypothetical protein
MSKVFYESVTTNWSSSPKSGKVHGTRNIVRIKNGKGVKTKEALNAAGKVIEKRKQTLKKKDIQKIVNGKFVPGLWRNCTLKNKC